MTQTWRSNTTRDLTLSTVFEFSEFIFLDTETTGLNPKNDYIIELAAIKYRMDGVYLVEADRLHLYLKPPFMVNEKITELTGITNEFLSDKPTWEDAFPQIYEFFGETPVIAAYNTPFDKGFMAASYERSGARFEPVCELDVLEMARDCVRKEETKNYKLGTIATLFGFDAPFHSAIEDIRVTKQLFDVFLKQYMDQAPDTAKTKIQPRISTVSFWEGYKGFNRIYVQTDSGNFYYDIRTKVWGTKDSDFDEIDMEFVEKAAWNMTGASNQKEFEKFKGKVTA